MFLALGFNMMFANGNENVLRRNAEADEALKEYTNFMKAKLTKKRILL
jgi:hypothetical protein